MDRGDSIQCRKRVPLGLDHAANALFGLAGEEIVGENEGHQKAPSQRFLNTVDEPSHSKYGSGIAGFELEGEIVTSLHVSNLELRDLKCSGVKELAATAGGQNDLLCATLRRMK